MTNKLNPELQKILDEYVVDILKSLPEAERAGKEKQIREEAEATLRDGWEVGYANGKARGLMFNDIARLMFKKIHTDGKLRSYLEVETEHNEDLVEKIMKIVEDEYIKGSFFGTLLQVRYDQGVVMKEDLLKHFEIKED